MSPTLHKILMHGVAIISTSVLPVGKEQLFLIQEVKEWFAFPNKNILCSSKSVRGWK